MSHARLDNPVYGQLSIDAFDFVMMPVWESWAAEINLRHLLGVLFRSVTWPGGMSSHYYVELIDREKVRMTTSELAVYGR